MAKYKVFDHCNCSNYEELCRISHNLRHFSKKWKLHYGSDNRKLMLYWEDKLDAWLKKNVDYTDISHLLPKQPAQYGTWAVKEDVA